MTRLLGGRGTGVGPMPGVDPLAAARTVFDEVALPYVPELPARGLGADPIGRAAALLVDIPVDVVGGDFRLGGGRTRLMSRAEGFLRSDLDAVEEVIERSGSSAPVKLSVLGPFSFAALVELPGGHKLVHDPGAWRDVVASLGEGLAQCGDELARRFGSEIVVQLDEPLVGRVVDGQIAPLTRLDVNPPIPVADVAAALSGLVRRVGRPMVLHTGDQRRWDLVAALPGWAASFDLTGVGVDEYDALGAFLDVGGELVAGIVPIEEPSSPVSADELATRVVDLVDRIGLPRTVLVKQVAVAPAGGLAGAGDWAGRSLALATRVAEQLGHAD
ncbi:MAG: vitamin-B12 independent methionine synthase [Gordonia sp. (in: high G+C Gram-positive bacteria)]|uniref:vitamin-B12 independent methionine synthase n=1 Tax=Gordonia sp. (in: high G+C Gram-positive bacteria) TaxID=84139 RepID=UPI0039E4CB88